ncbi:MAG: ribonuclease BN [Frankiales bacterium]|nr:ribonuclease BN [Frankiales bacterium]
MFGFPYAVIKKYGDDEGGRHAALITYYGFLSLFPFLLLVTWSLSQILQDPATREKVIAAIVPPEFADTIDAAVRALPSSGIPLVIGIVGLLFSGLGVVFTAYQTLNHIAAVPHRKRLEFLPRYLRVVAMLLLLIVGTAGIGFLTAAAGSIPGLSSVSRVAAYLGTVVLVFLLLWAATGLLLPGRSGIGAVWPAALVGGIVVAAVLTFGTALLTRLVQRSGAVYGSFATIVGFFTLMYLVSQVLVYGGEVAMVRRRRLWPRALDTMKPTDADRRALALLAREQERLRIERIGTRFDADPD